MNAQISEAQTAHFSVKYPESLEVVEAEHAELVLAFREDDGQFRPNIVFTVEENSAPLSDAVVRVLQLAPEIHRGVVFPSVDLWGAQMESRRITMLYPAESATDVCVRQWVWATGTHHVFATASMLPFQWQWAEPTLEWVAHQVTFGREIMPQAQDIPTEFPTHERLTEATGVVLERLDVLERTPEVTGMPIGAASIDLLKRTVSQLRLGSKAHRLPKDARSTDEAAELERLGLATGDGLSPFGESVALTLVRGTPLAEVMMWLEGRQETFHATVRDAEVVIVHTGGVQGTTSDGRARLVVCGVEQILRHLFEWISLAPRYAQATEIEVAVAEAQERCAIPQSAGGWRRITVQVPELTNYTVLVTPEHGALTVEGHDASRGTLQLSAHVPGELFEELRASMWHRMTGA